MGRHIFLSYVRQNSEMIDRLAVALRERGVDVWLDRDKMVPGQRWKDATRSAIKSSVLFVACFSKEYAARNKAFMNEELTFAIDELRERHPDCVWFVPVSLDGSQIPHLSVSGHETLQDRHWVDLSKDWDAGVAQIARAAFGGSEVDEKRLSSLQDIVRSWSTSPNDDLTDPEVIRSLGAKLVIDDVLVDCTFGGFDGVDGAHLIVEASPSSAPGLPPYVYEARALIPPPQGVRTKTYLAEWRPPILDQGNFVRLYTGFQDSNASSGLYDYLTTKAVVQCAQRIQHDILDGSIDLRSLARRLDLVVVVVTSDDKLVLARRGETVDNMGGYWMASIGESVDGEVDRNGASVPDPTITLTRCMTEADELNLTLADLDHADVTYLGLATEWAYMYVNLLVLVKLAVSSQRVLDRASHGEHSRFETVDFTLAACLPLLGSGAFVARRSPQAVPLVPASRVALLLSLFSRFGYDQVVSDLQAAASSAETD